MSEKSVSPDRGRLGGDDIWSSALEDVFEDPKGLIWMSSSCVDIFDVIGGKGLLKRGLNDAEVELAIQVRPVSATKTFPDDC